MPSSNGINQKKNIMNNHHVIRQATLCLLSLVVYSVRLALTIKKGNKINMNLLIASLLTVLNLPVSVILLRMLLFHPDIKINWVGKCQNKTIFFGGLYVLITLLTLILGFLEESEFLSLFLMTLNRIVLSVTSAVICIDFLSLGHYTKHNMVGNVKIVAKIGEETDNDLPGITRALLSAVVENKLKIEKYRDVLSRVSFYSIGYLIIMTFLTYCYLYIDEHKNIKFSYITYLVLLNYLNVYLILSTLFRFKTFEGRVLTRTSQVVFFDEDYQWTNMIGESVITSILLIVNSNQLWELVKLKFG
jgi:hypothetical protein